MQARLLLHPSVVRKLLGRSSRLPLIFAALVTSAVTICAQPVPVGYLPCDEGVGSVAHDKIGNHDAVLFHSYGSPSYYLQVMFDWLHGDVVLPTTLTTPGAGSMLYRSVTRDSQDGTVYLKLVNMAGQVQPLHVDLNGAQGIAKTGIAVVLKGSPQDTNSLSDPYKVVPTTASVDGLGQGFDYKLPPYSITVLRLSVGDARKGRNYEQDAILESDQQD